jgi:2-phosphosulfolactate phosphatase
MTVVFMSQQSNKIEVCLTPALYNSFRNDEAVVVIVDILRATSAICTAFMNGVERIIPVATVEEAKIYKDQGYLVAAERDGIVKDFADFGNSPYNFTPERISGKTIVYSTTNGTNCIQLARESYKVYIGSFLNLDALAQQIIEDKRDVVILCAGWKDKFNLEDTVYAGALAELILKNSAFNTICDSTKAAMDLWSIAHENPYQYILKAAQKERLQRNGLDDVIEYCHTLNLTSILPFYQDGFLIKK